MSRSIKKGPFVAPELYKRIAEMNAGNEKHTKRIPPTVYLMKHVTVPAVLVECGFLTNREETKRLQDETYQRALAVSIAAGYLRGTSEGELS